MSRRPQRTASRSDPSRTTRGSAGRVLHKSLCSVVRKNYREIRPRVSASSSAISTDLCETNPIHLTASLEITMTNEHGETKFIGSGVFTLPRAVRLSKFTLEPQASFSNPPPVRGRAENTVVAELVPVTFNYAGYLAHQRIRDKKLRKHDCVINKLVDEYAGLNQREEDYENVKMEEARNYRRKMRGETSGVVKEPVYGPLKKVKIEEPTLDELFGQVRASSSPCFGAPSV